MATRPDIRDAGDSALLLVVESRIDPEVNARAVAIARAVGEQELAGVRDVLATYCSVAVHFDPLMIDADTVRAALAQAHEAPARISEGRTIDVPVAYGGEFGPDLMKVAAFASLSPDATIRWHASTPYRVFMLGFVPGFAYMGIVDERIAAPRHEAPRVRVPAGSVGIAGRQTGIYPSESPGGWQIIGRTAMQLFDADRTPASLLAPGDTVRFVPTAPDVVKAELARGGGNTAPRDVGDGFSRTSGADGRYATVLRPGLLSTIQDEGRWGSQASGIPIGGPLDRTSHRIANAIVGNDRDAATLEVTLAGPELRIEQSGRIACVGADLAATLDGAEMPAQAALSCRAGAILRFGERRSGVRAYVAFDGGIDVKPVLGSRSTHVRSGLGGLCGKALAAGDRLPLGPARVRRSGRPPGRSRALPAGGARLRVLPGPQLDFFPEDGLAVLQRGRFTIASQSDRMGYRLSGVRIPRIPDREMISDATFIGGIQVPPSGEPILLMADRPTAGGYPQIATVITADLPMAGQLAAGDWIELSVCSRVEAIAALVAEEGMLLALG